MNKRVRIWTLNQATTIIQGKIDNRESNPDIKAQNDAVEYQHRQDIEKIFSDNNIDCLWGDLDYANPSHQLMYESGGENDVNEYFVPIPLKCLGDKLQQPLQLDNDAQRLLDGIRTDPRYPYLADATLLRAF